MSSSNRNPTQTCVSSGNLDEKSEEVWFKCSKLRRGLSGSDRPSGATHTDTLTPHSEAIQSILQHHSHISFTSIWHIPPPDSWSAGQIPQWSHRDSVRFEKRWFTTCTLCKTEGITFSALLLSLTYAEIQKNTDVYKAWQIFETWSWTQERSDGLTNYRCICTCSKQTVQYVCKADGQFTQCMHTNISQGHVYLEVVYFLLYVALAAEMNLRSLNTINY